MHGKYEFNVVTSLREYERGRITLKPGISSIKRSGEGPRN